MAGSSGSTPLLATSTVPAAAASRKSARSSGAVQLVLLAGHAPVVAFEGAGALQQAQHIAGDPVEMALVHLPRGQGLADRPPVVPLARTGHLQAQACSGPTLR